MKSIIVEIRSGEGGLDAKLLVEDQTKLYLKFCIRRQLEVELIERRPGLAVLQVTGQTAVNDFRHEAGGHRWQRIPPTEKRGRVQTSTVTVATLPVPEGAEFCLSEKDLNWAFCRAGGKGGQHVNRTDSAVQLTHRPSGMMVRVENERSQSQNKAVALAVLRSRLAEKDREQAESTVNASRRSQVGAGMRGDKRRTIALQRDQVTDHITGKRVSAKVYLTGEIDRVW